MTTLFHAILSPPVAFLFRCWGKRLGVRRLEAIGTQRFAASSQFSSGRSVRVGHFCPAHPTFPYRFVIYGCWRPSQPICKPPICRGSKLSTCSEHRTLGVAFLQQEMNKYISIMCPHPSKCGSTYHAHHHSSVVYSLFLVALLV